MSTSQVTISVVVDEETQRWLQARAKAEDRSVSSVVRAIISEFREKFDKLPPPPSHYVLPGNDY